MEETGTKKLRVLVVEDSPTIRRYLVSVLRNDPKVEIVGEADNGRAAVDLCASLRPDVVTMDMMLPEMNGVQATEEIMAFTPTPILVVSSSINRGEAFRTYEALAAGAVDVLDKPSADGSPEVWEKRFLSALHMVARIKVITHPRGRLRNRPHEVGTSALTTPVTAVSSRGAVDLIAIGASTGGPAAIANILHALPASFPVPILVVLHISELFAFAFAEWLGLQTELPVRIVKDGESIPLHGEPIVLVAPAGRHTVLEKARLRLSDAEERNSCKPSIDVLFESVAREMGPRAGLVLLTGMGKDGAMGLNAARMAGADTVAQDEASSIVYGMPAEAVRLGAARQVLGLEQIAEHLKMLALAG